MIPASAASGMRWDGDTRGHGVANGEWIAPEVEALVAELRGGDWIAEEPESHLGKHLREACDAPGSPWTLHEAALGGPVFAVTLEWSRPSGTWRELRADAYALLGSVAESTSFTRQRIAEDMVEFRIMTGMLSGDTSFASHGHLLPLKVNGAAVRALLKP